MFLLGGDYAPSWLKPKCLKNLNDRLVYKKQLTSTYTYCESDDLLAKKQDFIDQYTSNEKMQREYFISSFGEAKNVEYCKAWRDHEQVERGEAQKAWRQVIRRNHSTYMCPKYMNQNTR